MVRPARVPARGRTTIAAIGRASALATVTACLVLTACSSYHPRPPTPTPFPRNELNLVEVGSVLTDYDVRYPAAWTVDERRSGQIAVLTPPEGKGILRLIAMRDPQPPGVLTRAYVEAVCARALLAVKLQANIGAVRVLSPDHTMVLSDGAALGTTIAEVVHVFRSGNVLVAFFRAPSRDIHFATARRIMKGLRLRVSV
ncbi:MAG TPA: hypothetical protein VF153_04360 [Candidatus Limnocylindria bacterium]